MLLRVILLGCLASLARPETEVAFRCPPKPGPVCLLTEMKFPDPEQALKLHDTQGKTHLNVRAGSIGALTAAHCRSLRAFAKVTIGRTGLRELCIAKAFVHVSAENNHIRVLHLDDDSADGGGDFRLETLKLNNNQLGSLEGVGKLVALKELHLERNVLTALDMGTFAPLTQLEKLFLAHNRLSRVTTGGVLVLPKLSVLGLANNTLTRLTVQRWEMASLATLTLASNNLTEVSGLGGLTGLDEVSLAGNWWECLALEGMLRTLADSAVTITDGDRDCEGSGNSSICCTVLAVESEGALMDKIEQFARLEERYNEATRELDERIAKHQKVFASALDDTVEQMARAKKPPSSGVGGELAERCLPETTSRKEELPKAGDGEASTGTEAPKEGEGEQVTVQPPNVGETTETTGNACDASSESCTCSRQELDAIASTLQGLQKQLDVNLQQVNGTLQAQPHLTRMAMVIKHEFRTAVARGDRKLRDVNTKLAMLRDHIKKMLDALA